MPNSKFDLKMQCIAVAKGNITEAEKLYDFLVKDIELPDVTTPPPSTMEQIRTMAGNMAGWVKENKDDLVGAFHFLRSLRGGVVPGTGAAETVSGITETVPPLQ